MLDAATYTITYQTKTIWSGIFSVFLLDRTLKLQKWAGLCLLALGVGLVQNSGMGAGKSQGADELDGKEEDAIMQRFIGALILLFAAALSSMAGVYFEKILKGVQISLWARNLQLAFYSCVAALVPLLFSSDLQIIQAKGFFYGCVDSPHAFCSLSVFITSSPDLSRTSGRKLIVYSNFMSRVPMGLFVRYTSMTWMCIFMNAGGGLLVGAVIKYADAVTKDFAIGASIVLSSVASTQLFGFEITPFFFCGGTVVVYAVFMYAERVTCMGLFKAPPPEA